MSMTREEINTEIAIEEADDAEVELAVSSAELLTNWLISHQELQEKILDYLEGAVEDLEFFSFAKKKESAVSLSKKIREWSKQGYSIDQMAEGVRKLGSAHPYELVRTALRRASRKERR